MNILQAISNDTEMILHSTWKCCSNGIDDNYCAVVEAVDNLDEIFTVDEIIDHKLQKCLGLKKEDYLINYNYYDGTGPDATIRMLEFIDEEAYTLFKLRYMELN